MTDTQSRFDTKRMRACAPLLPEPGDRIVLECLDEIERLSAALAEARGMDLASLGEQSRAWNSVVGVLDSIDPNWHVDGRPMDSACATIRRLAAAPPAPAAEPVAWAVWWQDKQKIGGVFFERTAAQQAADGTGDRVRPLVCGDTAPPPVEASQPAAHEPEWTLWQFQRADGAWSQFMDERHYENTRDSDGWNMRRIVRVMESSQQQCPCGDRETSQCPGEWEPGCDLGANEAHARRVDEPAELSRLTAELAAARAEAEAMRTAIKAAIDCGMVPTSSAREGGACAYSVQAQVADMLRDAITAQQGGSGDE